MTTLRESDPFHPAGRGWRTSPRTTAACLGPVSGTLAGFHAAPTPNLRDADFGSPTSGGSAGVTLMKDMYKKFSFRGV